MSNNCRGPGARASTAHPGRRHETAHGGELLSPLLTWPLSPNPREAGSLHCTPPTGFANLRTFSLEQQNRVAEKWACEDKVTTSILSFPTCEMGSAVLSWGCHGDRWWFCARISTMLSKVGAQPHGHSPYCLLYLLMSLGYLENSTLKQHKLRLQDSEGI